MLRWPLSPSIQLIFPSWTPYRNFDGPQTTYKRSLPPSTRRSIIILCTVGTIGIILTSLLVAFMIRHYVMRQNDPAPMVVDLIEEFRGGKKGSEGSVEEGLKEGKAVRGAGRLSGYQIGSLNDDGTATLGGSLGKGSGPGTNDHQSPTAFAINAPSLPPTIYVSSSLPPSHTKTPSKSCIAPQPTNSPDGYRKSYVEEWYAPGPGPYSSTSWTAMKGPGS